MNQVIVSKKETLEIVNPESYGIEKPKALELLGNLPQIKNEREVLEKQYSEIIVMDIEDPETAKKARQVRLLIKDNRTKGINVWHKNSKEFFLRGSQFVDAIKKIETDINERMEENLEQIEKYAENKEKERIETLRANRTSELEPYAEFVPFGIDLGNMSEEDFSKTMNGAKLQFEAKIEAEKKAEEARIEAERIAEEQRIAKEKADAEERERIRIENEKLKAEAEAKEKQLAEERAKAEAEAKMLEAIKTKRANELQPFIAFIRDYNSLINKPESEYKAEFLDIKKGAELQWEFETTERIRKQKEEEERDAKLKAEQEVRAKLEAELKAKKDAEEKAEQERLKAEAEAKKEAQKLAKAGDKAQLNAWVDSMVIKGIGTENMKQESIDIANSIFDKFESFKKWAKMEIEKI